MPARRVPLNLTIDADLREKMKAYKVNWSEVAEDAFASHIGFQDKKTSMSAQLSPEVIERLAKSKNENMQSAEEMGLTYGEKWAKEVAEYTELRALHKLCHAEDQQEIERILLSTEADQVFDRLLESLGCNYSAAYLFFTLLGLDPVDEKLFSDPEFQNRFINSALDVYQKFEAFSSK